MSSTSRSSRTRCSRPLPTTGSPAKSPQAQQTRESAIEGLKPYSNEEFDEAIVELTVFAQKRFAFVTKQLDASR